MNSAPHHAVVKAALAAMTLWVRDQVPPPSPSIELLKSLYPTYQAFEAKSAAAAATLER